MFWSVKYTFIWQNDTFKPVNIDIFFANLYITYFVPNLIPIWGLNLGPYGPQLNITKTKTVETVLTTQDTNEDW